jgi:hypothetical protein
MIETLELQAIRRIGELIKGIGSQLTDYADSKQKQIAEEARRNKESMIAQKPQEARLRELTVPSRT